MKRIVVHGYPFAADIVVSLVLFVGRHMLANLGYDEATVGSLMLFYGIGYVIASLLMTQVVKSHLAKAQMLVALGAIAAIALALANVERLVLIQILYGLLPFATSLFFNALQIYTLGIATEDARPLAATAGHFTFSWSIGFALGPFLSSQLKGALAWTQIYYLAAVVAGLMVSGLLSTRRSATARTSAAVPDPEAVFRLTGPELVGPTRVGLLVGWTVWNAVLIYWPIQAEQLAIDAGLRSVVESSAAIVQGLAALALVQIKDWHYKPGWLMALGAAGVASLALFSTAAQPLLFAVAALCYGLYSGSMFSNLVYHALGDPTKAVRRTALNEALVGLCFLAASPVATGLHRESIPFGPSYWLLATLLAAGITLQALYARAMVGRSAQRRSAERPISAS